MAPKPISIIAQVAGSGTEASVIVIDPPSEPVLLFNLGVALEDSGRFGEALRSYELCIAHAPDFADAHFTGATLAAGRAEVHKIDAGDKQDKSRDNHKQPDGFYAARR